VRAGPGCSEARRLSRKVVQRQFQSFTARKLAVGLPHPILGPLEASSPVLRSLFGPLLSSRLYGMIKVPLVSCSQPPKNAGEARAGVFLETRAGRAFQFPDDQRERAACTDFGGHQTWGSKEERLINAWVQIFWMFPLHLQ
jgi:hypothetical protein